jgi:Fe-Mn family superoxide dismutase
MFKPKSLPYDSNALEPFMSANTLEYHHGKHYKGYVENLNKLIKGTVFETETSLIEIIKNSKGPIFNNAAQMFNHEFFFSCLVPNLSDPVIEDVPKGKLFVEIEKTWGSYELFKEEFVTQSKTFFGCGWCWLYYNADSGKLKVKTFENANNPLTLPGEIVPLITVDLWEHSYLYDPQYVANRSKYVNQLWKLISWKTAGAKYEQIV